MLGKKSNLICPAGAERAGPHYPLLAQCPRVMKSGQGNEKRGGRHSTQKQGASIPKQSQFTQGCGQTQIITTLRCDNHCFHAWVLIITN